LDHSLSASRSVAFPIRNGLESHWSQNRSGPYNDDQSSCVTVDFLRCVNEIFALLGCYAASADRYLRTFRDNFSVPPSMVKQSTNAWPSQMGTIGCPETSVTNYQSRLRNIKEQQIFHQNSCPWCEINPDSPCSQLTDESRCISMSILKRRKLHRVTWALMNAWRGSEFVRKTYFALSKDRVSAARIIQSSVVALKTSTHTHTWLRYTAHEEMCVFVYVNMLLLPTGRKNGKVHTSHYGLCKKKYAHKKNRYQSSADWVLKPIGEVAACNSLASW
jgi:hypothetical protein